MREREQKEGGQIGVLNRFIKEAREIAGQEEPAENRARRIAELITLSVVEIEKQGGPQVNPEEFIKGWGEFFPSGEDGQLPSEVRKILRIAFVLNSVKERISSFPEKKIKEMSRRVAEIKGQGGDCLESVIVICWHELKKWGSCGLDEVVKGHLEEGIIVGLGEGEIGEEERRKWQNFIQSFDSLHGRVIEFPPLQMGAII